MKKSYAILIVLIASLSLLTIASAADVSIESKTFHIPDGYSENTSAADTWNDGVFDHNYKEFYNDDKNISIEVMFTGPNAQITSLVKEDSEVNKTIGFQSGLFDENDDGNCCFRYIDGDKEIVIYAPDEATIEQIIK